ncbi:conserved hypothetical protein [Verticillium alfalfae VaMs.102]|uniref:Uncharacterized protein n=1 Tax=Verticillium alfalfae (strain VaMs.102 / ATCC MYA-4576 / FGSC 10136) TaxID=526221 RepID=C9SUV7_VERA1|nr:conserved hypothetical protein [Verticillium alfalfae VaMs.102]EEY22572.1 conserved hypothetical protein [Verticillium alfalfae VaMs.102]
MVVQSFQQQLDLFKSTLPAAVQTNATLLSHVAIAEVLLYEIGLPESQKTGALIPHTDRLGLLWNCLTAAKTFMDIRFAESNLRPRFICLNASDWLFAVLVALKLRTMELPGWDLGVVDAHLPLEQMVDRQIQDMDQLIAKRAEGSRPGDALACSGMEGTTASSVQVRKSTLLQQGSPQAGSSPAVSRGTHAKELFRKQLIRSVQSSSDFDEILQAHDAEGQAQAIAEAVHEQLSGRGALPILSSWKTLNLFAQGQSFAAGVLSGLVTVEFLVNTTDDSVFQQRAQELSGMDRSELKEQLLQALRRPHRVNSTGEGHGKGADSARAATTAAGPSTTTSNSNNSKNNNNNNKNDSPVRGAGESRRKRPVKLPSWGNRAVKDGQ